MKVAIIQFPGSNCESESIYAVRRAGMEPVEFLWNQEHDELKNFDGYFIVGGFSYEDRSRSGIIASLDPLLTALKAENEKGKPILGVCNGAQILVESGIVPGLADYAVGHHTKDFGVVAGMALAVNKRVKDGRVLGTGFYNSWSNVQLSAPSERSAFTRHMKPGEFINIPVAHGEGRFTMPDELLAELIVKNQTVFRYCDDRGEISSEFPVNPNGSMHNLAAVCNAAGNAMAMMPHPERTPNGQAIFTSMREYVEKEKTITMKNVTDNFRPTVMEISEYKPEPNSTELVIGLIITDNEAGTVKNTLRRLNIDAEITKYIHWEISADDPATIVASPACRDELFNSNKEKIVQLGSTAPVACGDRGTMESTNALQNDNTAYLLVRYREDFVGQSKQYVLENRLGVSGVKKITKGTLWKISAPSDRIEEIVSKVISSRILFNQFSQGCFKYI
ncbi:phosphoribosylformylglycinamidine synthase I [Patescibacteria group bacterium]|nr:MAG: phosphoribosylformylglycinamidine synthase I [Patescibacteria group bacterium]